MGSVCLSENQSVCSLVRVRVRQCDAKTTHPELFYFCWGGRGTHGMSASGFGNSKRQGETEDNGDPSPS